MRTFDCTEAQVRLNECGEGEYVRKIDMDCLMSLIGFSLASIKHEGNERTIAELEAVLRKYSGKD